MSDKIRKGGKDGVDAAMYIIDQFANGNLDPSLNIQPGTKPFKATWRRIIDAAEQYNEPGRFRANRKAASGPNLLPMAPASIDTELWTWVSPKNACDGKFRLA